MFLLLLLFIKASTLFTLCVCTCHWDRHYFHLTPCIIKPGTVRSLLREITAAEFHAALTICLRRDAAQQLLLSLIQAAKRLNGRQRSTNGVQRSSVLYRVQLLLLKLIKIINPLMSLRWPMNETEIHWLIDWSYFKTWIFTLRSTEFMNSAPSQIRQRSGANVGSFHTSSRLSNEQVFHERLLVR